MDVAGVLVKSPRGQEDDGLVKMGIECRWNKGSKHTQRGEREGKRQEGGEGRKET